MDVSVMYTFCLSVILSLWLVLQEARAYVVTAGDPGTGITCWTCPEKGSNSECNDWAPDRVCPNNRTVCQTVHRFRHATGESVRINKQCVLPVECTHEHVGCRTEGNTKVCVSCCNTPYCNKDAPHNNNTAISLSVTILQSSSASYATVQWSAAFTLVAVLVST